MLTPSSAILYSRLATKSGDHAWELTLPIVLTQALGGSVRMVALLYLVLRVGQICTMTQLGRWLDRSHRLLVIRRSITLQGVGVLGVAVLLQLLRQYGPQGDLGSIWNPWWSVFALLACLATLSSIGATLSYHAVFADWIPCLFDAEEKSRVNSRLKQIDLSCEVAAPLLAGLLLSPVVSGESMQLGFYLILAWNLLSFIFEYALLRWIYARHQKQLQRSVELQSQDTVALSSSTSGATVSQASRAVEATSWGAFWRMPVAATIFAYALLWCTVLSPHGPVLTAFLSAGGQLDERALGVFRAAGAFLGILPTLFVPALLRRWPIRCVAFTFICFQAFCLVVAVTVLADTPYALFCFLLLIALSRIGLYGYSLCEIQLRQDLVPEALRGSTSGKLSVLTNACGLLIVGLSVLWGSVEDFHKLAIFSTASVCLAAMCVALSTFRSRTFVGGGNSLH
jgi:iron-regulated transporter 1